LDGGEVPLASQGKLRGTKRFSPSVIDGTLPPFKPVEFRGRGFTRDLTEEAPEILQETLDFLGRELSVAVEVCRLKEKSEPFR